MMSLIPYLQAESRYMALFGVVAILGVAFLFSRSKRNISFRLVTSALAMQFIFAFIILKTSYGYAFFSEIARVFSKIYMFADEGTKFIFGNLASAGGPWGFIFIVKVIPIIIFFGALTGILFHFGIIQVSVYAISLVIRPFLGTSGAETLCCAAHYMLGQTEAPLLVKRYLTKMTESEMFLVMVSGMAMMSGSIMAVYGSLGVSMVHLLSASAMSIPGSILVAKILMPEVEKPVTAGTQPLDLQKDSKNVLDALATGTFDGMTLSANVTAMLISFISLIALVNFFFGWVSLNTIGTKYTMDSIFAGMFSWVTALLGIAPQDCTAAGTLIGQKLVINEFVAYTNMLSMHVLPRTQAILTYALGGFANISSIGIQIGGIGALAPAQRPTLIKWGVLALLGGTLTNLLNAAIASLFI